MHPLPRHPSPTRTRTRTPRPRTPEGREQVSGHEAALPSALAAVASPSPSPSRGAAAGLPSPAPVAPPSSPRHPSPTRTRTPSRRCRRKRGCAQAPPPSATNGSADAAGPGSRLLHRLRGGRFERPQTAAPVDVRTMLPAPSRQLGRPPSLRTGARTLPGLDLASSAAFAGSTRYCRSPGTGEKLSYALAALTLALVAGAAAALPCPRPRPSSRHRRSTHTR